MLEWLFSQTRSRWDSYVFMALGAALSTQQYAVAGVLFVSGAVISGKMDAIFSRKSKRKQ